MTKQKSSTATQKNSPSDEYKALIRAAAAAKKQAELLGVPYITKNGQSEKASV